MDPVHGEGPWTWSMKGVHGPGPKRGSMDQGSMFCPLPYLMYTKYIHTIDVVQNLYTLCIQKVYNLHFNFGKGKHCTGQVR